MQLTCIIKSCQYSTSCKEENVSFTKNHRTKKKIAHQVRYLTYLTIWRHLDIVQNWTEWFRSYDRVNRVNCCWYLSESKIVTSQTQYHQSNTVHSLLFSSSPCLYVYITIPHLFLSFSTFALPSSSSITRSVLEVAPGLPGVRVCLYVLHTCVYVCVCVCEYLLFYSLCTANPHLTF